MKAIKEISQSLRSIVDILSREVPQVTIDTHPTLPPLIPNGFCETDAYKKIVEKGKYTIKYDNLGCEVAREYRGDNFCLQMSYLCYLTLDSETSRRNEVANYIASARLKLDLTEHLTEILNWISKQNSVAFYLSAIQYNNITKSCGVRNALSFPSTPFTYILGLSDVFPKENITIPYPQKQTQDEPTRKAVVSVINGGRSWSAKDMNILRSMVKDGKSVEDIASTLGRTECAIRARISITGRGRR